MAFVSKNTVVGQQPAQSIPEQSQPVVASQPQSSGVELGLSELEFLLSVLKNADLKGHQVEMFYNMIVKLQNMYLKKSGK